jgi:hypothetical protein
MTTFLSDTYKPKLIENKIIKKMIDQQNNHITFETKIKTKVIDIFKNNYKVIIGGLFFIGCLYWRYNEIQQKRYNEIQQKRSKKKYNETIYEEDSENLSSEEY